MLSADGFGLDGLGAAPAAIQLEETLDDLTEPDTDGWAEMNLATDATESVVLANSLAPVWINADGGDWNDPNNWAGGAMPATGANVVIEGLNADAIITLNGTTVTLGSFTLKSGTLIINGSLYTGRVTLESGAHLQLINGQSNITGGVQIAAGAELRLSGTAKIVWSSGNDWDNYGTVVLENGTTLQATSVGELNQRGGLFQVDAGAQVLLTDTWGNFFVRGGEYRLNGTHQGSGSQVEFVVHPGAVFTGTGTLINARTIEIHGRIDPGATGEGSVGHLRIQASVNFSTATWSVHLDVADIDVHDVLEIAGGASFSGSGRVEVDASTVNFEGLADGTALAAALLTVSGSVSGSPSVQVVPGFDYSVTATWNAGAKRLLATTLKVVEPASRAVVEGLLSGTSFYQAMLAGFNLDGLAFTLPGLTLKLADAFGLDAWHDEVALPVIGLTSNLPQLIADLEAAGFVVEQPGNGVQLRVSFSRVIADNLAVAVEGDEAFVLPAELTAGWAGELDVALSGALTAQLVQNLQFEVRDGVFYLLVGNLRLQVAGAASAVGSVRSGGRTVSVAGEIDVDYAVWLHQTPGGPVAQAIGESRIELGTQLGALNLVARASATRLAGAELGQTISNDSLTLDGELTLADFTAADGSPLTIALTGARAVGADAWQLAAAGTEARLLGLNVDGWTLGATLTDTTITGTGEIGVRFDFLRLSGEAPVVGLTATFDAETIALSGQVSGSVGIASPAGTTYLMASDFAGAVTLAGQFGASGVWTQTAFTYEAGLATFGAAGSPFTATITNGADADAAALVGSYDFGTQVVTTVVDQFALHAVGLVGVQAAGLTLRHTRNGAAEQELARLEPAVLELLFLTSAPGTGPPSLEAELTLRTDTVSVGASEAAWEEVKLAGVATLRDVALRFDGLNFGPGGALVGGASFTAVGATLLKSQTHLTIVADGVVGEIDFGATNDRLALQAESVEVVVMDWVTFRVEDIAIRPEAETLFALPSVALELAGFGLEGEATGLVLTGDGALLVDSLAIDTTGWSSWFDLAGVLPFKFEGLTPSFHGDANANGVRDAGEEFRLDAFDLTARGTFDFSALGMLPFTPVIRVGEQTADDAADQIAFTLRNRDGVWRPWNIPSIELGLGHFAIGGVFEIGGNVTLGGYVDGEWSGAFGGVLHLNASGLVGELGGEVTVTIAGELDLDTRTLDLSAAFLVSFRFGEFVEVEGAALSFGVALRLITTEAGGFTFALPELRLGSASVSRLAVNFGGLLVLEANEATFNFFASGDEMLLSVASLTATMPTLGFIGAAENFGLGANGLPKALPDFAVRLTFDAAAAAAIEWPEWLPVATAELVLHWPDLTASPLDFTLRLNAEIGTDGLAGSELRLYGNVRNLVIDVGALTSGKFAIMGIGSVALSVSGKIATSEVAGEFLLGLLRLDANGEIIADDDITTEAERGVLWGAVRGSINLAGYGGLTLMLGVSQYGPLQGYVKLATPLHIPKIGIAFTDLRAGITFNATLPGVDDARELQDHPLFTPVDDLSFDEWREVLLDSLAMQVTAHAQHGTLGVLLNPFVFEGGLTIYSIYASTGTFNFQGDFKGDSTGKFLARGALELGGTISFTANLYLDLSGVLTGNATLLFLAELPSELPIAIVYGGLSFEFGEPIDENNPPPAPFESFVFRIAGGAEFALPEFPPFVLEGELTIGVALDMPSLTLTVNGRAAIPFVGDFVSLVGDFRLGFGEDGAAAFVGVFALAPSDLNLLANLGVSIDALVLLRFNTGNLDVDYTLSLGALGEPRTITLKAKSASLLIEGVIGLAPEGVELFQLTGALSLGWAGTGFDVLVAAQLKAGVGGITWLRYDAEGYLRFELAGVMPGMAAHLKLAYVAGDDLLARLGFETSGAMEFIMNTTGRDVEFTLPTELAANSLVDRILLPRGPPTPSGGVAEEAAPYLIVRYEGVMNLRGALESEGVFFFMVADDALEMHFAGVSRLGLGEITFYRYESAGVLRLDESGAYGRIALDLVASAGFPALDAGFSFEATFFFEINTTGVEQTLGGVTIEAGSYARVRATGALVSGLWRFVGTFDFAVSGEGVEVQADAAVSLGVAGV